MDDESFDDGIADEDLMMAFDELSSSNGVRAVDPNGTSETSEASQPIPRQQSVAEVLEDLPSDAFSSSEPEWQRQNGSGVVPARSGSGPASSNGLSRSQSGALRQTTLWGSGATIDEIRRSQAGREKGAYRADRKDEAPTQHKIDREAMQTWVYPTNLGAIRDYQFSIVKNSLFNNTLVALPTGLGKTFIAATVMLNYYRWTKEAKIIFVAPTKPLVSQQIDACFHIAGIPRSDTTLLTGAVAPALRADEWKRRRVFFMTPQTLVNDISHGYADPKSIALIVIDEAHRATGEYAYAKATKMIRNFSSSFRVLALTATPGSKVETVQEVIDNLGISHCEIRTEESLDIRQYVHNRNIDQVILDPSDEMHLISELFAKALKPMTEKLAAQNIWYGRNPMAMTTYGLIKTQKDWFANQGRTANDGIKFMMRAVFGALTSFAHSIKLLQFHGLRPFYDNMVDLRKEVESKGEKGSKYRRQVIESADFQEMMQKMDGWFRQKGFVGHPKLTALAEAVLNHFMDVGDGSRVIVFSEYRDSADEIVRTLAAHRPLVKPTTFVGQADGKRGEGMTQKEQMDTIERFKKGDYNVLVATSIGEEGLDIGQVDLIVCYDASASPIRMLQRMGRTGRKRAGNIVLLLMRGKEEEQFAKSKDNYEKMQQLICDGNRFNFRFDLSTRIVPRDIRPEVDKRHVDIPIENTQDVSLPEPKNRRAPAAKKKMPTKKFHMPDGVETGFQTLAEILKSSSGKKKKDKTTATGISKTAASKPKRNPELDDLVEIPALERVVLGKDEALELNRSYRDLPFNQDVVEETEAPCMTAHPEAQRKLRPVAKVQHGANTKRWVGVLGTMASKPYTLLRPCRATDASNYREIPVKPFAADTDASDSPDEGSSTRRKRQLPQQGSEDEASEELLQKRRKTTTKGSAITAAAAAGKSSTFKSTAMAAAAITTKKSTVKKSTVKRKSSAKSRPSHFYAAKSLSEAEETDDDGTDEEAGQGERHPRSSMPNPHSDELGDDCERDSDLADLDMADSDDGSDLMDFVIRDSQVTSSMRRPGSSSSSSSSSSSLSSSSSPPRAVQTVTPIATANQPYFVPTHFAATPDSDSLEDIDALMGLTGGERRKQKHKAGKAGRADTTSRTSKVGNTSATDKAHKADKASKASQADKMSKASKVHVAKASKTAKANKASIGRAHEDDEVLPAIGRARARRVLMDSEDDSDAQFLA